jgi:hypothetical protein
MPATVVKRNHHQNSDLEARPLNSAYFEKQTLTDSVNVILGTFHGGLGFIGQGRRISSKRSLALLVPGLPGLVRGKRATME